MWRHTRRGDRYVTVIIDLTPVRDRSGPARLVDVVPGRSKTVFKTWLAARGESWRGRVEVVATGRFHRVPRAPPARSSHKPGRSWIPFTSWPWRPASSMSAAAGSRGRSQGGGAGQVTGSTGPGAPC